MKSMAGRCIAMLLFLVCHSAGCAAEQEGPGAIVVVNLGSQPIQSFTVIGFGFRDVHLDRQPGETLTPSFSSDATTYELYWQLADGSVFGKTIDLSAQPRYDNVVISIHDDHLELTTARVSNEWHEYRRVGNPSVVPRPEVPYYAGCQGPLLSHPIGQAAWLDRAQARRTDAADIESRFRCALDWYIPVSVSPRTNETLDDVMISQFRLEWKQEVEEFRKRAKLHK